MNLPLCRTLSVALALAGVALAADAAAADLPHRRAVRHRAPPRVASVAPLSRGTSVLIPAVPEAPVVIAAPPPGFVFMPVLPDPDPAPRRGGCLPGYMIGAEGVCRRAGELVVACDPFGGPCSPVPQTPIPYGIGPYLRQNY